MSRRHNDFDQPKFDIEMPERPPFTPVKSNFSIKTHPVLFILLLNCISLAVIFFIVTGGHPIEGAQRAIKGLAYKVLEPDGVSVQNKTYQELFEEDKRSVGKVLDGLMGKNVDFVLTPYDSRSVRSIKRQYPSIAQSSGNLLIKNGNEYFYLSQDAQRLYNCKVLKRPPQPVNSLTSKPAKARPRLDTVSPTDDPRWTNVTTRNNKRIKEEYYKDSDGVWRNRFIEISESEEIKSGWDTLEDSR